MIPTLELALRASVPASTGYSSFEIVFGSLIKLPWENISKNKYEYENVRKYLEIKEFYRTLLHKEVKENVGENKRRNEKYQKRFQSGEIKKGDYVYVKNNLTKGFGDPKCKGSSILGN